jgi:MinD-like ATPase involved in chromosome partitioning or flagellar assembly
MAADEIIIEIQRIGAILRVAAVDVATGTEVVFQAPASASRASIDRLAASKLQYVMRKGTTPPDDSARGGAVAK